MAMMAMTTKSSIKVKPRVDRDRQMERVADWPEEALRRNSFTTHTVRQFQRE